MVSRIHKILLQIKSEYPIEKWIKSLNTEQVFHKRENPNSQKIFKGVQLLPLTAKYKLKTTMRYHCIITRLHKLKSDNSMCG